MKIVADERIPFLKGILEPYAEVKYINGAGISSYDLSDVEILIIRSVTKCNENLLKNTAVKLIATATIGVDHIDSEYCKANGIEIVSAPGCNSQAVVQYFTAALLEIYHSKSLSLEEKKLGIIGVGNVGKGIMDIAGILGLETILNDPPRASVEGEGSFKELNALLDEADIVTLHVPLNVTGEYPTIHLADREFFQKVKRDTVFINTSRGPVVSSQDLKTAILEKSISSTVLDVWENEPHPEKELVSLSTLSTPHIAGYSLEGKANATAMILKALVNKYGWDIDYSIKLPPLQNVYEIDCEKMPDNEILHKAVKISYDIKKDDTMFRQNPSLFAELRNNYSFRREFTAYKLKVFNCNQRVKEKLSLLGFSI